MEYYKCAFNGALMGKQFGCQYAMDVTRREGPSIACTSQLMQKKCALLLDRLKAAALPQFGYEDDLTQMPHSVMLKIQMGGLSGLQNRLKNAPLSVAVEDIQQVVNSAEHFYGDIEAVSLADIVPDMVNFKLPRRRR